MSVSKVPSDATDELSQISYTLGTDEIGTGLSFSAMAKAPGTYSITATATTKDGFIFFKVL